MQELHSSNRVNTNDTHNKTKNNSNLSDNLKILQKSLCQKIIELHQHRLSLVLLVDDGDKNNTNDIDDGADIDEKKAVAPAVPSSKVSISTAEELLGPIIHAAFVNDVSAVPGDDVDDIGTTPSGTGRITPLMVACDKDHVNLPCLKYFVSLYSNVCKRNQTKQKELLDKLLGHCLCSSATDGHNQAIHYAALSLPETALEYLAQIFQYQQALPLPQQGKERSPKYSFQKACLVLLSQVNDHGDTPLMLAAANGKRSSIEHWIQLLLSKPSHDNDGKDDNTDNDSCNDDGNYEINNKAVVNLLSQQNKSNDTVLSLAYGYGHYDIVEFLIGGTQHCNKQPQQILQDSAHHFVPVQYQDVQQCKALLEKLNVMEQQQVDKVNMDEFQCRKKNIQACYDLLLEALTKQADQAVSSLLLEEEKVDFGGEGSQCNKVQQHGNKKKIVAKQKNLSKKKKKSRNDASVVMTVEDKNKSTIAASCTTNDEKTSQHQVDGMVEEPMPMTTSTFVTMSDGTVVSCQQYLQSSSSLSWSSKPTMVESTCTTASNSNRTKSINHLLRDRCNDTWNRESEELMEALCLDASMLLLSPQSMALNLSPSQLETVETVLNLQLKAVETAKTIHARLMSTK